MMNILKSKINWAALMVALIAVVQYLDTYDTTKLTDFKAVGIFVISIAIIILRTYFTKEADLKKK